jgi:hypothetical protein
MDVSGQIHTPATLHSGEIARRYPFDRRQDGPQSGSGRCEEEKNSNPNVQPTASLHTD